MELRRTIKMLNIKISFKHYETSLLNILNDHKKLFHFDTYYQIYLLILK